MTRDLVGALVLALAAGLGAPKAEAQGIRVAVGINTPPVQARIAFGDAAYYVDRAYLAPEAVYGLPVHSHRRVVIHGPYAYRYRHHYTWVDDERARLARMYLTPHEYRKAVRAFERERAKRERELERDYHGWLRDHGYARHPGRGHGGH
jgi:hypothetical protein